MDTDAVRVTEVPTTAEVGAARDTSMREDTVSVSGGTTLAVAPPDAVPVMVSACVPAGVAPAPLVVVMVMVLVQGTAPGVQDAGVNDADAPVGRPDAEKVMASLGLAALLVFVAVMMLVLFAVAPCMTEMSWDLARV